MPQPDSDLSALSMQNIRKSYGTVVALDGASLEVAPGTIHAILGENGAGKTTLMRIAFGAVAPDAGGIQIDGTRVRLESPADAIRHGVGMVHQHFTLVPVMTVAENIALGGRGVYDDRCVSDHVAELATRTGLSIDPSARISSLSVGGQQRVEILKALVRNARILILDEPTAVLPPSEAESLLNWLQGYVKSGHSAILITHKVRDALRVADYITVLRQGRTVHSARRDEASGNTLAAMMVEATSASSPRRSLAGLEALNLEDVSLSVGGRPRLSHVNLSVRGGEILGVAGVEGSGHGDLLRILANRNTPTTGVRRGPDDVAFAPEDRHRDALALDMSATENIALRGASRRKGLMRWKEIRSRTRELADAHDVRGPIPDQPVRQLSGGNQQKLVIARELAGDPMLIVAENPTRGLDPQASHAVHSRLLEARSRGAAVVVYSTDIEELLTLADRTVVVHAGQVREVAPSPDMIARALVGLGS